MGKFVPGADIEGVTIGRGNYNAIYKQMVTKFEQGMIRKVTLKTALKMFVGRTTDKGFIPGFFLGDQISRFINDQLNMNYNRRYVLY